MPHVSAAFGLLDACFYIKNRKVCYWCQPLRISARPFGLVVVIGADACHAQLRVTHVHECEGLKPYYVRVHHPGIDTVLVHMAEALNGSDAAGSASARLGGMEGKNS